VSLHYGFTGDNDNKLHNHEAVRLADNHKNIFTARQSYFKQHRWLIFASTVVIVLTIVLALAPVVLRQTFANLLTDLGATQVSIEDVDFNLFSGELVVENTHYTVPDHRPFECGLAVINIDILPLFANHFFINNVRLDGCELQIERTAEGTLNVDGIVIPAATKEKAKDTEPAAPGTHWLGGVHRLSISNTSITYHDARLRTVVNIKNIAINDIFPWDPDVLSTFAISLTVNGAPVILEGAMKPFADERNLTASLSVSELDLEKFAAVLALPGFSLSSGRLTTELSISSALNDNNEYDVNVNGFLDNRSLQATAADSTLKYDKLLWKGKLQFAIDRLDLKTSIFGDYNMALDRFDYGAPGQPWKVTVNTLATNGQLSTTPTANGTGQLHVVGDVKASNVLVSDPVTRFDFARIGSIDTVNLEWVNDQLIRIPSISVRNAQLAGSQDANKDPSAEPDNNNQSASSYLATFSELAIKDSQLQQLRNFTAASVKISNLESRLVKSQDGSLKYINELQQTLSTGSTPSENTASQKQSTSTQPPDTASGNAPVIQIGIIETAGNNSFAFEDYSVKPAFQTRLHDIVLKVVSADNTPTADKAKINLSAGINDSGHLSFKGTSQLFSPQLHTKLRGNIKNLELSPFSGYVLPVTGRKIRHGRLNATISLDIDKGQLDNNNKLVLRNFAVIKDDDSLAKRYDEQMPLPLEMAIDFLKDKKGRIELSVPVKGSLENPAFDYMPAVAKAIRETMQYAALSYLKYTLQPWGTLISVGELVAGKMSKITFDPLPFEPGSTNIGSEQTAYLDKIAKLMHDTPHLGLTVCGVATAEDRNALLASSNQKPAVPPDRQQLISLAQQRANAVKNYFTQQKNIDHSRLHDCSPTYHEQSSSKPAVEFVF
jgi:hypothetical protein